LGWRDNRGRSRRYYNQIIIELSEKE
jgi:hypothetical protein